MDEDSARFLDSVDVPFIKIGSGDVNNLPLITTGTTNLSEVLHKKVILKSKSKRFTTI